MEQKFKVGDRVRHGKYGKGSVVHIYDDDLIGVSFDGMTVGHGCSGHCVDGTGWYCKESTLTLVTPASPTPDRAMIAAMCLQGMLTHTWTDWDRPIKRSVELADALIAELQKPKQ